MQAQGIEDSREAVLAQVERHASQGVERVQWMTARDVVVCLLCRERDGKQYTIDEVRHVLAGEFCRPDDTQRRCRCTLMPAAKFETAEGELRPAGAVQTMQRATKPSSSARQVLIVLTIVAVLALLWLAIR